MSRQVALAVSTEEVVLAALRLRAAREGARPEEVAGAILRAALAPEIEEASGLPPLAHVIQQHHQEQQAGRSRRSTQSWRPAQELGAAPAEE